VAQRQRLES